MPLAFLPSQWLCPASWLPVLLSYENCVLIRGDILKLRAACGTWNCPHSDFIQSNNSIWCYRNLILMIISIYNSPSSSKCLHWRGISMEKVNLFKNVNFFVCEEIKWDAKLSLSLCCPSLLSTYCSDQYDIFTCSNADGGIYLLMEIPHFPIHCQLWLYSRQSTKLETPRPWSFGHPLGGKWGRPSPLQWIK